MPPLLQPGFMFTGRDLVLLCRAVLTVCLCFSALSGLGQQSERNASLGRLQVQAIVLAVQDEIYDFGYQKQFYEVGAEHTPGVTRLPLYIQPRLKDREGSVIYKLMPHGEVIRSFHFNKDGLAVLEGAPDGGFPPTQPNTLTVYMDDDRVCRWKHEWVRTYFDILDAPTSQRVSEASERQKQRVGYSAREAPPKDERKYPPHDK